jgi:hypothetical protein
LSGAEPLIANDPENIPDWLKREIVSKVEQQWQNDENSERNLAAAGTVRAAGLKGKNLANDPFTVTGLNDPASLALAPRGTPLYQTTYGNVAPRVR